ncbi:unnamed protein product [Pedinophyceae sp. YPF-701]|nr:unnamed protein product [Pedinophyceae sp. YPF-701]
MADAALQLAAVLLLAGARVGAAQASLNLRLLPAPGTAANPARVSDGEKIRIEVVDFSGAPMATEVRFTDNPSSEPAPEKSAWKKMSSPAELIVRGVGAHRISAEAGTSSGEPATANAFYRVLSSGDARTQAALPLSNCYVGVQPYTAQELVAAVPEVERPFAQGQDGEYTGVEGITDSRGEYSYHTEGLGWLVVQPSPSSGPPAPAVGVVEPLDPRSGKVVTQQAQCAEADLNAPLRMTVMAPHGFGLTSPSTTVLSWLIRAGMPRSAAISCVREGLGLGSTWPARTEPSRASTAREVALYTYAAATAAATSGAGGAQDGDRAAQAAMRTIAEGLASSGRCAGGSRARELVEDHPAVGGVGGGAGGESQGQAGRVLRSDSDGATPRRRDGDGWLGGWRGFSRWLQQGPVEQGFFDLTDASVARSVVDSAFAGAGGAAGQLQGSSSAQRIAQAAASLAAAADQHISSAQSSAATALAATDVWTVAQGGIVGPAEALGRGAVTTREFEEAYLQESRAHGIAVPVPQGWEPLPGDKPLPWQEATAPPTPAPQPTEAPQATAAPVVVQDDGSVELRIGVGVSAGFVGLVFALVVGWFVFRHYRSKRIVRERARNGFDGLAALGVGSKKFRVLFSSKGRANGSEGRGRQNDYLYSSVDEAVQALNKLPPSHQLREESVTGWDNLVAGSDGQAQGTPSGPSGAGHRSRKATLRTVPM